MSDLLFTQLPNVLYHFQNRKLWYACCNGDATKVERCIDYGACIDYFRNVSSA